MNHINDIVKEEKSESENETIRKRLLDRDRIVAEWLEAKRDENALLSTEQIEFLGLLAEKNLKNLSNKQGLTLSQRKIPGNIRRTLRNAVFDLERMGKYGFLGVGEDSSESIWNPKTLGSSKDREMFKKELLKKDFPVRSVSTFVECLVRLYGDEYAIPLAFAIQAGLTAREPWESDFEVDVPVLRRSKGHI